jgi:hypothetical protein
VGHVVERCDIIDELEASARLGRPLAVTLKHGRHFVDQARDVITEGQDEWAVFRSHESVRVADISACGPAEPPEPSYRGKL